MRKGMTANLPYFTLKAIKGTALITAKNFTLLDYFHNFNV